MDCQELIMYSLLLVGLYVVRHMFDMDFQDTSIRGTPFPSSTKTCSSC